MTLIRNINSVGVPCLHLSFEATLELTLSVLVSWAYLIPWLEQYRVRCWYLIRCVMCHEWPCHIKNYVPHIYRRYSVKKFSRLVSSKSVELTSKILSCEGRDLLLQLQLYRQLCPTQERIFEVNSADFEDTNLENFFTEYLLYMCGKLFLMWQCDLWHMTHLSKEGE